MEVPFYEAFGVDPERGGYLVGLVRRYYQNSEDPEISVTMKHLRRFAESEKEESAIAFLVGVYSGHNSLINRMKKCAAEDEQTFAVFIASLLLAAGEPGGQMSVGESGLLII